MNYLQSKKIIIFGTGKFQEMLGILPAYYLDNNEKNQNQLLNGVPINSPEKLKNENFDDIYIYIASTSYHQISEQLKSLGLQEKLHFDDAAHLLSYSELRVINNIDSDIEDEFIDIFLKCKCYTMTSLQRMYSLYQAIKYISLNGVPGDFVECGVWRGGSAMVIAHTLKQLNDLNRKIYLYDTYTGMVEPSDLDCDYEDTGAFEEWSSSQTENYNIWCYASIEDVENNLFLTDFPKENIVFVKGKVEDTIPDTIPEEIALLRLDTDWYESTYHEMVHLYPKLGNKCVLIIDDYGHWQGAKRAVDQYFEENNIHLLLNKIDYSGRIAIKSNMDN